MTYVRMYTYVVALIDISKHTDFQKESLKLPAVVSPQLDNFRWHVFTEAEAWVCLELFAIDVPLLSYQCLAAVFLAEH